LHRTHRPRRSIPRIATLLYVVAFVAWHVLRLTPAAHWWLFELLDALAVWSYVAVPLLALLSWLARDWRPAGLLAVPVLIFGLEYGALFLPNGTPGHGTPVRVMTSNLLESNDDYESLAAVLAKHQPDLVVMQELGSKMGRQIAARLRDEYPYQALYPADSTLGMGILSRYPIRAAPFPAMRDDPCRCQQATVEVESRPVLVVNVHPFAPLIPSTEVGWFPFPTGFRAGDQEPSLETILERTAALRQPLLVMGDFNATDRQPAYRLIRQRLRDAYYEAGWGFGLTFPSRLWRFPELPVFPLVRIDYVFHDDSWSARAAWNGYLPGSDHLYVVADLALR
jgi:vancomycin resistance protein VanJ